MWLTRYRKSAGLWNYLSQTRESASSCVSQSCFSIGLTSARSSLVPATWLAAKDKFWYNQQHRKKSLLVLSTEEGGFLFFPRSSSKITQCHPDGLGYRPICEPIPVGKNWGTELPLSWSGTIPKAWGQEANPSWTLLAENWERVASLKGS